MITKKQINVFIVEDNEIYLKTLEKNLRENFKSSIHIDTFLRGEECLDSMVLKPDIIILDYFLNSHKKDSATGTEILKKVKKISPETAVVMLSSQDNMQVATDTMKFGAFDYVSKNENAFLRIQNAIKNINKMVAQAAEIKTGRKIIWFFIALFALIVVGVIAMQIYFPRLIKGSM